MDIFAQALIGAGIIASLAIGIWLGIASTKAIAYEDDKPDDFEKFMGLLLTVFIAAATFGVFTGLYYFIIFAPIAGIIVTFVGGIVISTFLKRRKEQNSAASK